MLLVQSLKGNCHENCFLTETVGSYRLGTKDVSDPNFIVLRCPFNLLRIFKDGVHRSKTEFMLGPGSGVNVSSDTILFVDLPYTNIHASYSHFSKYPSSGDNLTPEPDSTPIIALF